MSTEKDIHLDEDQCFANQTKYAVISFCSSKSRQRIKDEDSIALKIRGCFNTTEEAMAHVKLLSRDLDAYIMEMYKWTLLGNVEQGMDTEDHLVDMIKCHKKKNADAREEFKKRKEIVQKEGLEAYNDEALKDAAEDTAATDKGKDPIMDIKPISAEDDTPGQISMHDIDAIRSGDLQFAVISIVERDPDQQSLSTPRGCVGVKIRGAFATKKECEDHIEKLGKLDTEFDMYIVDLYKFLMLPPDSEKIDTRYREEYLQELFTTYQQSQQEAKAHLKEREAREMQQALETPVHPAEIKAIDEAGPSTA